MPSNKAVTTARIAIAKAKSELSDIDKLRFRQNDSVSAEKLFGVQVQGNPATTQGFVHRADGSGFDSEDPVSAELEVSPENRDVLVTRVDFGHLKVRRM